MRDQGLVGVLGGMGPIASAEFVRTVYEHCAGEREQAFPALSLHSDPAVPARTADSLDRVPAELARGLWSLADQGCSTIVMCCMTAHRLLPLFDPEIRDRVLSVLDVLVDEITRRPTDRRLLLCSSDSREMGLFEGHPGWASIGPSTVLTGMAQARRLQDAIQAIKERHRFGPAMRWLTENIERHAVSSVIVGCSEIHVLVKRHAAELDVEIVDPFDALARAIAGHGADELRIRLNERSTHAHRLR